MFTAGLDPSTDLQPEHAAVSLQSLLSVGLLEVDSSVQCVELSSGVLHVTPVFTARCLKI